MAERRALSFSSLDEVMPEVDRLLEGHTTTGRWSLGQICNHLGTALRYTVEGFPEQAPWLLRQHGRPGGEAASPRFGGDAPKGSSSPRSTCRGPASTPAPRPRPCAPRSGYYPAHAGPLADHPLFGSMSRDEWDRYHAIHCAHHLSFARPHAPS